MSRWIEFAALYVGLPVALMAARLSGFSFPVLPLLWAAALPAGLFLVARCGWGRRELLGGGLDRRQAWRLAWRVGVAAAVLSAGAWVVAPEMFLSLPRRNVRLWAMVMAFYPLLSVYPQGILYRGLFHARYAGLLPEGRTRELAAAAVFALAHLAFANVWAVALTLAGGFFIDRTYRKTGSLMASNLEHALYGQIVFTSGWGRFLYHGTARLVEGLAG